MGVWKEGGGGGGMWGLIGPRMAGAGSGREQRERGGGRVIGRVRGWVRGGDRCSWSPLPR